MNFRILIFLAVFVSMIVFSPSVQASHEHRVLVFPFEDILDFEIDNDREQISILVDEDFSFSGIGRGALFHPNVILDAHTGTLHFDSGIRHLPPSHDREIIIIPTRRNQDHIIYNSDFIHSHPHHTNSFAHHHRNRIILSGSASRIHIPKHLHPSFSLDHFEDNHLGDGRHVFIDLGGAREEIIIL